MGLRGDFKLVAELSRPGPEVVERIGHDRGTDDQHAIGIGAFPTHAGAGQTSLELFDTAFNGSRANGVAVGQEIVVEHPAFMSLEVSNEQTWAGQRLPIQ